MTVAIAASAEVTADLKSEMQKWGPIIEEAGIRRNEPIRSCYDCYGSLSSVRARARNFRNYSDRYRIAALPQ